jgi:transposase-like protein
MATKGFMAEGGIIHPRECKIKWLSVIFRAWASKHGNWPIEIWLCKAHQEQRRYFESEIARSLAVAVRSWGNNWEDLATMFAYPPDIGRLIATTNTVEGYNRQLRKVTKSKGAFPTGEAARKLFFLANRDITRKWTAPVHNWTRIRNQLAIRYEGRFAT